MLRSVYIVLTILVLVSGCKSQKTISGGKLLSEIVMAIGDDYQTVENSNHTFMLAWAEDISSGTKVIKFGVWEIATGIQVYKDSIIEGKVQWMNDTALYLEDAKGIVDEGTQIIQYKIDLLTKTKTRLNGKVDF